VLLIGVVDTGSDLYARHLGHASHPVSKILKLWHKRTPERPDDQAFGLFGLMRLEQVSLTKEEQERYFQHFQPRKFIGDKDVINRINNLRSRMDQRSRDRDPSLKEVWSTEKGMEMWISITALVYRFRNDNFQKTIRLEGRSKTNYQSTVKGLIWPMLPGVLLQAIKEEDNH